MIETEERVDWSGARVNEDGKIAAACRVLLERYQKREITSDEYDLRLAYISLEIINDYSFVPPPEKPYRLMQFEADTQGPNWNKKGESEKAEVRNRALKMEGIPEYFNAVEHNMAHNTSNAHWLEQLIRVLRDKDPDAFKKVWNVYINFPLSIWYCNRPVWKRKEC